MRAKLSSRFRDVPIHLGLLVFGIAAVYPLLFVVLSSFKNNTQFYQTFWAPTLPLHLENYRVAFRLISRFVLNSVIYSGSVVIGVAVLSAIAGFVFARYRFPGKQFLFLMFISLIMVPGVLTLAPRFVLIRDLDLINHPLALILPWLSTGLILGTWLMRTYFESVPQELFDAAHIDGAADHQVFLWVAAPLAAPMFATVSIMSLIHTWNDLIWPLVTISEPKWQPLAQGLVQFSSSFETDWGPLFAGYVIASVPLLLVFVVAMKQFISGLTSGAIKA